MSATSNQPENKNFLSPLGFKFLIKKTPNVNWFVQNVTLPLISLARTDVQTPFIQFPVGGDHLIYNELEITFKVDEDMANYLEIFNWLNAIGFPDTFNQFREVAPKNNSKNTGITLPGSGTGIYSDASLLILTSSKNPNIDIQFFDLFPTSLSTLPFSTQSTNVNYLTCGVSFAFRRFTVNRI